MKKTFINALFVFIFLTSAYTQNKFQWPLPQDVGKVIGKPGYIINPKTKKSVFNSGYFISAQMNTPVYAVEDGTIVSLSKYIIMGPKLQYIIYLHGFETKAHKYENIKWVKRSNIIGSVGLLLENGTKVYYSGLMPGDTVLNKSGVKVKKGDLIGHVGKFNVIFDEPCIRVSLSKANGKVGDIGIPLLGEDNKLEQIIKKNSPPEILKKEILLEAFDIFREALEEGHPSLYKNLSKTEFDLVFQDARNKITSPMKPGEFRAFLMPLISKIGCSHTYLSQLIPAKDKHIFPLWLSYVENKCIVVGCFFRRNEFLKGCQILEIDDKSIDSIVSDMQGIMFNDVQEGKWKNAMLVYPNWFYFYLKNALGGVFKKSYQLKYKSKAGEMKEMTLELVPRANMPKSRTKKPAILLEAHDDIRYKMLDADIAYISLQTCSLNDYDTDKLTEFIDSLNNAHIGNLILDLRHNRGGNNISKILACLVKGGYHDTLFHKVNSNTEYKIFRNSIDHLPSYRPFSGYVPNSFIGGYWKQAIIGSSSPSNKHFKGKIYVLTGPTVQSYAAILVDQLKKNGATHVGEIVGGSPFFMNGTDFARVKLGESNLVLTVPLVRTVLNPTYKINDYLEPDYHIPRTMESLLQGSDNQLDSCLKLIKQ